MKHTDLVIILDRSGSMADIQADVEGGFRAFVKEQRTLPGTCNVTLVHFDTHAIDTVYTGKPIAEVPDLELVPRGGTPLLDAVGQTVTKLDAALAALPPEQRPEQVMVLVITDGQENSSREFRLADVKRLIETHQGEPHRWAFVYLGANVDAFAEAGGMGIPLFAAAPYAADAAGVHAAFVAASANLASYRSSGTYGFTDEQRRQMKLQNTAEPDVNWTLGADPSHTGNL